MPELLVYVAEILGFVAFAAFSTVLKITSKWNDALEHERLSAVYRKAVYRPWNLVDETKPPEYSP